VHRLDYDERMYVEDFLLEKMVPPTESIYLICTDLRALGCPHTMKAQCMLVWIVNETETQFWKKNETETRNVSISRYVDDHGE
jgi:hypothetical protein